MLMFSAVQSLVVGVRDLDAARAVVCPVKAKAFVRRLPNPAFKRTHTGGAGLWYFGNSRAGAGRLTVVRPAWRY